MGSPVRARASSGDCFKSVTCVIGVEVAHNPPCYSRHRHRAVTPEEPARSVHMSSVPAADEAPTCGRRPATAAH